MLRTPPLPVTHLGAGDRSRTLTWAKSSTSAEPPIDSATHYVRPHVATAGRTCPDGTGPAGRRGRPQQPARRQRQCGGPGRELLHAEQPANGVRGGDGTHPLAARSCTSWPLAQARQIRPAAPVVAQKPGSGRQIVSQDNPKGSADSEVRPEPRPWTILRAKSKPGRQGRRPIHIPPADSALRVGIEVCRAQRSRAARSACSGSGGGGQDRHGRPGFCASCCRPSGSRSTAGAIG